MPDESTLRVVTFGGGWGLPTVGPFGLKLEASLRMLDLPYERVQEDDPRKGPKRKSPWIEDGEVRVGDTEMILDYLKRTRGVALDADRDATTRARAHALRRMVEEHFHQVFEYELLLRDEGFEVMRAHIEGSQPWPLSRIIPVFMRRQFRRHLFERGVARHSPDEVTALGRADIDALVDLLGDSPWFFGDEPTGADASAFGLLAAAIKLPLPTPVCEHARSQPTLSAYVDRALARFFPQQQGAEHAA